jgi:hypothetical protein
MRALATAIIGMVLACSVPGVALADAGLQINPLRYDDVMTGTTVKNGFIDVSNPSDTTVTIRTSVRGFKQADLAGDLAFFTDDALTAGIRPSLATFELGARESLRLVFSVDPSKLPQGGVYAAIFFTTIPPEGQSDVTYITETANVGTLLLLQNGGNNVKVGRISQFNLPFLQLGAGLTGTVQYQNTNRNTGGLAFSPGLSSNVFPWGRQVGFTGPFIMPQSTREFTYQRAGSYLGLVPVTLVASEGNSSVTSWVLACTGWYQWLVLVFALAVGVYWLMSYRDRKSGRTRTRSGILGRLKRAIAQLWRRNRKPPAKRPLDGLSHKSN